MQEPPTPITRPAAARGPRFLRGDGDSATEDPPQSRWTKRAAPAPPPPPQRSKPKLKKLRLAFILLGLSLLAVVSTVFGMLMAVASDLPSLENRAEYRAARNSLLYSDGPGCKEPGKDVCQIAALAGNQNRILLDEGEISPNLKNAVIAIEDKRFYEHEGVDYAGIARALFQDVLKRRAAQGGSTITQQFVKNALAAQGNRSVFQKLRESALAYNLERKWPKEKILTQYLNSVYFGNGAYGIEAAVRTYFGDGDEPEEQKGAASSGVQYAPAAPPEDEDPNRRLAQDVTPAEAALLAGLIASPSLYDPLENPQNATERRNLVLQRMLDQGMITRIQYEDAIRQSIPDEDEVDPPDSESEQPYFTSWMTQQLVDRYGAGLVFGGGLKIKTTIDPALQAAAEQAVAGRLAGVGPDAALVAIENKTGEVKAMVGGSSFDARPFNLATNGHRQPGSAFKPFTLLRALEDGIDPNSVWASQPKQLPFRGEKGPELFKVSNYEDSYLGAASLWSATATSDNSVFAEVGMEVKPKRVARLANAMGIRTELSTNPAMILGGLEEGVTPLEMAYAYSTIANEGVRVSGRLAPDSTGPVAFEKVVSERRGIDAENDVVRERVFPAEVGQLAKDMLSLVVTDGTGKAAQVGDEFIWGKTGTTENYGDAWFAGGNEELSVAIWVGYVDKLQPMEYEYAGSPVAGGTYPAGIFHDFMTSWVELREEREAASGKDEDEEESILPPVPVTPTEVPSVEPPAPVEPTEEAPAPAPAPAPEEDTGAEATPAPEAPPPEAPAPAPAPTPAPAPAPAPTPPPAGGTGGGTGTGGVPPG
jgi:penicillin-binding protein 1A